MKNTIRVRRDAGSKKSLPQAQTRSAKTVSAAAHVDSADQISLILISHNEGKEIAGIDLTADEYKRLKRCDRTKKISLSALLCQNFDRLMEVAS